MKKDQKRKSENVGLKHPVIDGLIAALTAVLFATGAFFIAAAYAPQKQYAILYASLIPLHIGEFIALIFIYAIYVIAKKNGEKYKPALLAIFAVALLLSLALLFLEGIFWREGINNSPAIKAWPVTSPLNRGV